MFAFNFFTQTSMLIMRNHDEICFINWLLIVFKRSNFCVQISWLLINCWLKLVCKKLEIFWIAYVDEIVKKKKKTLARRARRERQKIDNKISTKKIANWRFRCDCEQISFCFFLIFESRKFSTNIFSSYVCFCWRNRKNCYCTRSFRIDNQFRRVNTRRENRSRDFEFIENFLRAIKRFREKLFATFFFWFRVIELNNIAKNEKRSRNRVHCKK